MPIPTFTGLRPKPQFEDIVHKLNELADELTNLMLNLDDANFDKITANVLDVNELSAITANLGTITAGVLNAVTIIGSLIQTDAPGNYPRVELSSTAKLLEAATDALNKIKVTASFAGTPSLVMTDGTNSAVIFYGLDVTTGANRAQLQSDTGFGFNATNGDFDVYTNSGNTRVSSWNKFVNRATGNTLQSDLNAKANAFSGFTGSFSTGTQTVTVVNGIITSVV